MSAVKDTSAPWYDHFDVSHLLDVKVGVFAPSTARLPGFVTFYDPGWSIIRLRDAVANKGTIFNPQDWHDNEPFAKLEEPPRYRQLWMTALDGSFNKTFAAQQALLPADAETPTARVVIMGMVIHFLATGERLFPHRWVRCIDNFLTDHHVAVGNFNSAGFDVTSSRDGYSAAVLGLAFSRKC